MQPIFQIFLIFTYSKENDSAYDIHFKSKEDSVTAQISPY